MPYAITELEKAIVLAFLLSSKGKLEKFLNREEVLKRFKIRQRRMATRYMEKLVRKKVLEKKGNDYKLSGEGIRLAKNLLATGVALGYFRDIVGNKQI
ncbi:hypothetical protein EPN87_03005 [archaeon]|nr:MAG: hypothetical protein EPN87_03005 [archaeon]